MPALTTSVNYECVRLLVEDRNADSMREQACRVLCHILIMIVILDVFFIIVFI